MPDHSTAAARLDDLHWDDTPLWDQFVRLLEQAPDRTALIDCEGREWSRRELADLADSLFEKIAPHASAGSRVLMMGAKCPAAIASALAISRAGAIVCPFSTRLSEAEVAVLEQRINHSLRIDFPAPEVASLTPATPTGPADPRDAQTVLIGFTSGTTGVPKSVMHSATALNYATRCCAAISDAGHGEAILGIVPLDSAPGFTFTVHFSLSLGHPLVLIDRWDPVDAMRLATKYKCAWTIGVPTHLISLVEAAREGRWTGTCGLRTMAVGGSAMTADLIRDADELLGVKALRMYGMSECMGHCSVHPDHDFDQRTSFDGLSFPGTQDIAFDAEGRALAAGERGQAGVKGPSLFLGYAHGMGHGQEAYTPDGHFLTGDEIVVNEEGFVRVVGRIKDQIIRGGFNIDPAEIEEAVLRHPDIGTAAVVPVPHPRLGEQACAIVTVHPGKTAPDLPALLTHLEAVGLNKKKWPEYLLVVDALLQTANGKTDKKTLARIASEHFGPEGEGDERPAQSMDMAQS